MDLFKLIPGLRPLDEDAIKAVVEFERVMKEEVIPEIIKAVERRRTLAAEAHFWPWPRR